MSPSRREVLKTAGIAVAGVGAAGVAGCSSPEKISNGPAEVAAADVPVGSAKIIEGSNYVVSQPTAGKYCAFVRVCPHAGCHVTEVKQADIICTCHDSHFSIEDGACTKGPAKAPLGKANFSLEGSTIKVTP